MKDEVSDSALCDLKIYMSCCGYPDLEQRAYSLILQPPFPRNTLPPYSQHLGEPSYQVCTCCGFEFGNDDDPGTALPVGFEECREEWIRGGCQWFDLSKKPNDWNLNSQLRAARILD